MLVELDSFIPGIDDGSASAATEFLDEGCCDFWDGISIALIIHSLDRFLAHILNMSEKCL